VAVKSARKAAHRKSQPHLVPKGAQDAGKAAFSRHKSLRVLGIIAIAVVVAWILLALFGPKIRYELKPRPVYTVDSPQFLTMMEALADTTVEPHTHIEVLPNGENYYPAELDAIRNAKKSVDLEAYIFKKGKVADEFVEALTERAKAQVKVNVVLDGMGSLSTHKSYFDDLIKAGGIVQFYHPLRLTTWPKYNNRTHRELLVIDGEIGFLGGSGVADYWLYPDGKKARWRDTMFRIRGEGVNSLQGTFAENWLESAENIINGPDFFPPKQPVPDGASALVINSSPTTGGSTRARIVYQTLIASARKSILITTPYFLPDKYARREMVRAMRERGVKLRILVPGAHTDHALTRALARSNYGDLLDAGAEIYEYQPGMIHAKIMVVDGLWSLVGSSNVDSRSFGLNDEVNMAAEDPRTAEELTLQFDQDLKQSRQITLQDWKRRSLLERGEALLGLFFGNEQ
jgi:cardiolipin synthase A/B